MYCSYCGSKQHTVANCPKTAQGSLNRTGMRCSYCGDKNHNVKACPKTAKGNAARTWDPNSVANDFVLDKKPKP
jgi:hypothetical protein